MTQIQTQQPAVQLTVGDVKTVNFFNDPLALASFLAGLQGPQFLSFDAVYPMDEKMLKKSRKTKLPNPYLNRGLVKIARTVTTVNFQYQEKVEKREGEYSGKGSWSQVILVNGKPTPLSTHKSCIITDLMPGDKDTFANRTAVLDKNGMVQFTTKTPKLYIRYEIVRAGPGETREDKSLRSQSHFQLADGTVIAKDTLEEYLPEQKEREDKTDFQLTAIENITEMRAGGSVFRPSPVQPVHA
jgi:hypothetical protein